MSVPGEPRRVRLEAVNSTAVHVQWRPPLEREQNGVIRGYQVLYLRIDDREQSVGRTRVYDVMDGQCIIIFFGGLGGVMLGIRLTIKWLWVQFPVCEVHLHINSSQC